MFERTAVNLPAHDHKDTSAGKNQDKQLPKVLRRSFFARFRHCSVLASAQSRVVHACPAEIYGAGEVERFMGKIKLLFGLGVIVAVIYAGAEVIPPYFSNYEFEDSIKEEALHSTYGTKTEDAIRDAVFKKAQDLEIPLTREQIKVQRTGSGQGSGTVSIEADYSVHVDLPGYPLDLHFSPSSRNKGVF